MIRRLLSSWLLPVILAHSAAAQNAIRYIVTLSDPSRHLVEVTMEVPPGSDTHLLQLPVWNALYQVRDFSQYLQWIRAQDMDARPMVLVQLNASRWLLRGAERGVRITYRVFADNPDPYGTQLNSHHAFFNLAEILMYAEDARNAAVELQFRNLPANWKIATSAANDAGTFTAQNYDRLVDSPVEIGDFAEKDFSAQCGSYRVILDDESSQNASPRTEDILRKMLPHIQSIVTAETAWMSDCPFRDYLFIYHASDTSEGGGMEHSDSTAITLPAKAYTDEPDILDSITAHEFFHLWNVKRIRPQSLEPVDYTRENYTRALWFSEGVDSTVAEYILMRAGLLDERRYLNHLSRSITEVENAPAHLTQSAEQSSIDVWLEKYPYYRLPERSVSYYTKGELLGVLLDLGIREATGDHASLRDLFRWMNDHYAKQGEFFADSEGVQEAAEAVSHRSFADFFQSYVAGTEEIPWDRFFAAVGLRLTSTEIEIADSGFEATLNFDQPPKIARIEPGSGADHAGLKEGDTIQKINGEPAGRNFAHKLDNLATGSTLRLVVERDGVKRQLQWTLASRKLMVFQLTDVPGLSDEQKIRRRAWLFGDAEKRP